MRDEQKGETHASGYAKLYGSLKSMAEASNTDVYLEAVEKSTNEICRAATPWYRARKSMAMGKHEERLLENSKKSNSESSPSRQTSRISGAHEL